MRKTVCCVAGTGIFLHFVSAFSQDAAQIVDESALPGVGSESVFELLVKGGPVMIPIAICSLVAVTLFFERIIVLRKQNVVPPQFLGSFKEAVGGGKPNLDKAFELCVKSEAPIARIFSTGVEKWRKKRDFADVEKSVEDAASREVSAMERSLRGFKIVAGISPLLGLLGTVYGMIRAFQTVALSADAIGKAAKLAAGIYEAMVTTAAGLTIAIPTLLVYYFFARRVDGFADDIAAECDTFIDMHKEAAEK